MTVIIFVNDSVILFLMTVIIFVTDSVIIFVNDC